MEPRLNQTVVLGGPMLLLNPITGGDAAINIIVFCLNCGQFSCATVNCLCVFSYFILLCCFVIVTFELVVSSLSVQFFAWQDMSLVMCSVSEWTLHIAFIKRSLIIRLRTSRVIANFICLHLSPQSLKILSSVKVTRILTDKSRFTYWRRGVSSASKFHPSRS